MGGLPVILCEIDPFNSSLTKKYYYTTNSQILAQDVDDGAGGYNKYFYLHDRLGSVRMLIDDTATVRNTYTYNPFGEDIDTECSKPGDTGYVNNPWKYTGQYHDTEIDQYYLRARQYDPQMMRFSGRDPVKGKPTEPLTLHKFLYCANEPINRVDLDGRWAITVGGSLSGTASSKLLQGASKTGISKLANGGLGIHALARQGLIMLQALEVDLGYGGTAGLNVVYGQSNEGTRFGGVIGQFAHGFAVTNGTGGSGTLDFGVSFNAQRLSDLAGEFTEYGGSITTQAPAWFPFFGITGGFTYSKGDNASLWTVSVGTGSWGWKTGWEAHRYTGKGKVLWDFYD